MDRMGLSKVLSPEQNYKEGLQHRASKIRTHSSFSAHRAHRFDFDQKNAGVKGATGGTEKANKTFGSPPAGITPTKLRKQGSLGIVTVR
jgi:hypothetical protein